VPHASLPRPGSARVAVAHARRRAPPALVRLAAPRSKARFRSLTAHYPPSSAAALEAFLPADPDASAAEAPTPLSPTRASQLRDKKRTRFELARARCRARRTEPRATRRQAPLIPSEG
jgi:hypothetical protein